ncbi:MAG: hypothetical protein ACLRSW_14500 [Christensenellaceae bacterium]
MIFENVVRSYAVYYFDAAAVLAVMAIAYRWVFKRVWGRAGVDRLYGGSFAAVSCDICAREDISKKNGGMETLTARGSFLWEKRRRRSLCTSSARRTTKETKRDATAGG